MLDTSRKTGILKKRSESVVRGGSLALGGLSNVLSCRSALQLSSWLMYYTLGADVVHIENIHDAIRFGKWDFEPEEVDDSTFDPTSAMPGTEEKLQILAERARSGLPLWNCNDRTDYDETDPGESQDE